MKKLIKAIAQILCILLVVQCLSFSYLNVFDTNKVFAEKSLEAADPSSNQSSQSQAEVQYSSNNTDNSTQDSTPPTDANNDQDIQPQDEAQNNSNGIDINNSIQDLLQDAESVSNQVYQPSDKTDGNSKNNGENIPIQDITPPTAPQNLMYQSSSQNEITLFWSASTDDTGVAGYIICRDGAEIGRTTDTTFYSDNNVMGGITYNYEVYAFDASNNISLQCASVTASAMVISIEGNGLRADYFNNLDLSGKMYTRIDETVNFHWKNKEEPAPGISGSEFSVRWTGQVEAKSSELYTFYTDAHGGIRLWVNNELLINDWDAHNMAHNSGNIQLEAGKRYVIKLEYREDNGIANIQLSWSSPSIQKEVIPVNQLYPVGTPEDIVVVPDRTSMTISWAPVTYATGYDIEVDGVVINAGASTSYISSNLVPGTMHTYRVRSKSGIVNGFWSSYFSEATLIDTPTIMASTATENSIAVSWNSIDGAVGYDVEVDGKIIDCGNALNYVQDGLEPGTSHYFRVRVRGEARTGDWSGISTIWTLPDIPSNISLTSTSTSITISWDPVTGATGYDIEVYGSAVNNGPSTSYTHTGLEPNTQRTYRVRAKNSSGAGQWSSIVAKTTAPGTPTTITIAATDNSLELAWDGMAGATGYDIEVDGKEVIEVENNLYVHTGLLSNSEHIYRIRSKNEEGMSEWSESVKGITLPQTPADFRVSKAISSEITLIWDAVDGATGYDIEVDGMVLGIGNITEYNHIGLKPNTEHSYRVRARNGSITGAWTEVLSKTTLLPAPANLTATASSNVIRLEWDMVVGAESYDIEIDCGEIFNISGTEYTHSELMPNSSHTYRVRANNSNGAGDWSEPLTLKTMFGKPQNVTFSTSDNEITIRWDAADGAEGYEVLVDGDIVDNGADSTFVHRDLKPNSMHIYKIRAKNSEYTGEWSDPIAVFTLVGIPTNIKTSASSSEIVVSWDEVDGAQTYEIEADGNVISLGAETKFIHIGLNSNTAHNYRVRAINVNGAGKWSELVSQITAPSVPVNLKAESDINSIKLTWNKVDVGTYDIEVDGKVIKGVQGETYTVEGLEPNTRHEFRIRATNNNGVSSEWSGLLAVNTNPELVLNIGIDTAFNFVIVVPKKDDVKDCRIVVIYNPEQMEAADLYAGTQPVELQPGQIHGTSIVIEEFTPGRVVYRIDNMDKAVITIIKFVSKTNDPTKVSYTIE